MLAANGEAGQACWLRAYRRIGQLAQFTRHYGDSPKACDLDRVTASPAARASPDPSWAYRLAHQAGPGADPPVRAAGRQWWLTRGSALLGRSRAGAYLIAFPRLCSRVPSLGRLGRRYRLQVRLAYLCDLSVGILEPARGPQPVVPPAEALKVLAAQPVSVPDAARLAI